MGVFNNIYIVIIVSNQITYVVYDYFLLLDKFYRFSNVFTDKCFIVISLNFYCLLTLLYIFSLT